MNVGIYGRTEHNIDWKNFPWGIGFAIMLWFVRGLCLSIGAILFGNKEYTLLWWIIALINVFFVFLIWILSQTKALSFISLIGLSRSNLWKHLTFGSGIGILYLIGVVAFRGAFKEILSSQPNLDAFSSKLFLYLIAQGLIIPICEEIFNRGFLYRAFRKKFNAPFAILAASILFAISHPEPIVIFTLGALLCIVYEKTKSLTPCVVIHLTYNIIGNILNALYFGIF